MTEFRLRPNIDMDKAQTMDKAILPSTKSPPSPKKTTRPVETGGGDEMRQGEEVENEDTTTLSKLSPLENLNSIFQVTVSKKKNIYSTDPVPLNTPWTFWVDRTQRGVGVEQFAANLKQISTVYTVHRFWGVYYNIPKPSALHFRSSLHMMRDTRKPIWEETYNSAGGSFRFRCQKRDTDKVWRELLMAAIGEQLNEYVSPKDEICGISVTVRDREDTVSVWNTNAQEVDRARIFECLHMLLPDTGFISEFYKPHVAHHAFERSKASHTGYEKRGRHRDRDRDSSGGHFTASASSSSSSTTAKTFTAAATSTTTNTTTTPSSNNTNNNNNSNSNKSSVADSSNTNSSNTSPA